MKKILAALTFLLVAVSCDTLDIFPGINDDSVDWTSAVNYVFDPEVIPEIHISVTQEEWDKLLAFYDKNSNTQEYVACDVLFDKDGQSTEIAGAGLRLKGNTSRRRPSDGNNYHHCHFGVDLNRFYKDDDHSLKGLRKFDLKWFKDDAAYVREVFCYDLFRRQGVWTAIRDVHARLWLKVGDNEEIYYGVYGLMEHIDKDYLRIRKKQFKKASGDLWKCHYGADLKKTDPWIGADDNQHDFTYELKTNKEEGLDEAKARLLDFIGNMGSLDGEAFDKWIQTHMDVELLLKTYAVNVAVGMWDDYWNNTNNYYLYITHGDPYQVWFIPYDYDNTLGTSHNCGVQSDSGRQNPYKWGHDNCPLLTKILQNNSWKAKYKKYLQDLCKDGGDFSYEVASARIRSWQKSIGPYISNDTGEDMVIKDVPASWGNHYEYRLLEDSSNNNFFRVKAAAVAAM